MAAQKTQRRETVIRVQNIMAGEMMVSGHQTIKDQSDKMWESVFWDDDNYRQDKSTSNWTELYKSQSSEVQTKMAEAAVAAG